MDLDSTEITDEEVIALAANGFAEGANFATSEPDVKMAIKGKAKGFIKTELRASADKRKTLGVIQAIAAKAKKGKH